MAIRSFSIDPPSPVDVDSLSSFLNEVDSARKQAAAADLGYTWYFRGGTEARDAGPPPTYDASKDALLPSIGEPHTYNGKTLTFDRIQEYAFLNRFKRRAYTHFRRAAKGRKGSGLNT